MTLARSLVDCLSWCHPELQGLECSLVDRDPGPELRPGMTHDLELSCDGLELWPGGMFNFYCELFHISFIVMLAHWRGFSSDFATAGHEWFDKFIERKTI